MDVLSFITALISVVLGLFALFWALAKAGTPGAMGTNGTQGNQGPIGPDFGPQGTQGPQGDFGPQGLQGPQGVSGTQGDVGTMGMGTSMGPQGYMGPEGPKGNPGPTGIPGAGGNEYNIMYLSGNPAVIGTATTPLQQMYYVVTNSLSVDVQLSNVPNKGNRFIIENATSNNVIVSSRNYTSIYNTLFPGASGNTMYFNFKPGIYTFTYIGPYANTENLYTWAVA